jgi:large subunit ribosomal protein L25
MKTIEVNGHLREAVGGSSAKQLRREGHVPCVVYGGEEILHFYADERDLNKLVYTPDVFLITIKAGGKEVKAVLRDVQYHAVQDSIMHMDFVEVLPGKPVSLKLPVVLEGSALGVRNGGVLRRNAKVLYVRGMVDSLPDAITIDISKMRIGHSKKVGDLDIPGVEMLEAANRVVVAIKTSRRAIADDAEEEGEEGDGAEGEESTSAEGGSEAAAEAPAEG